MKDNRREFIKKGGALAALSLAGINPGRNKIVALSADDNTLLSEKKSNTESPGPFMKVALQAPSEPDETGLKFIQQLGIDHVVLNTDGTKASYEYYFSRRQLYETAGIKVYAFGNSSVHKAVGG